MTITPFELYCILKLDEARDLLKILSFIGLFLTGGVLLPLACALYDAKRKILASFVFIGPLLLSLLLLVGGVVLPTTKQAAALFVFPKALNSELVQEDLPKEAMELYQLAKEYLKSNVEQSEKTRGE